MISFSERRKEKEVQLIKSKEAKKKKNKKEKEEIRNIPGLRVKAFGRGDVERHMYCSYCSYMGHYLLHTSYRENIRDEINREFNNLIGYFILIKQ